MHQTDLQRVLVIEGYGDLGRPLSEALAKNPKIALIIGGRSLQKAAACAEEIRVAHAKSSIESCVIDWQSEDFQYQLEGIAPHVVVMASGPYYDQAYHVPKLCIELKIHYIDLADVRDYVTQIIELDAAAKENGVVVISGASTAPGLSSAVVKAYENKFSDLREIDFGITPSNVHSLLRYVGKPFQRLEQGSWRQVWGWQNCHRHYYGDNVGLRWHANIDVPDLDLFPKYYPKIKTVVFHSGLELSFLHLLIWNLSWITRAKLVESWSRLSSSLVRLKRWLKPFETNKGGMYIHMYGSNQAYQPFDINWTLISEDGHGQYIPVIGAMILINKILDNKVKPGAMPCMALYSLEEFESTALKSNWKLYTTLQEREY